MTNKFGCPENNKKGWSLNLAVVKMAMYREEKHCICQPVKKGRLGGDGAPPNPTFIYIYIYMII